MPWTLNGCGATSEFVELLNFGPGPINIGCYILTDGDFSVTIPPNTILQPGQFFVLSGQDVIPAPCANIDSTIHPQLNWNTCGCTSGPIPTTGDGFFTDGGSANEQVVLLDPNLNVVDAVVRSLPAESSSTITTSAIGGCGSKIFNLDSMTINYEVLGMSAGRGNSFARKLDGDCGWVKDPQQSANATNNTPGTVSDVSYSLTIVKSMDCDSTHGSISIYVNQGSATNVFPMNYTLAFDSNNDGIFDFSDTYTYGVDSTPSSIDVNGLIQGQYRITVGSASGCFLKTFPFSILPCSALLPVQLSYFKLLKKQNNIQTFEWLINDVENIQNITLEKSKDGSIFTPESSLQPENLKGTRIFTQMIPIHKKFYYYRLRLLDKSGKFIYSAVINTLENNVLTKTAWPNPARDKINISFTSTLPVKGRYSLYNAINTLMAEGFVSLSAGSSNFTLPVNNLPAGVYQLIITSTFSQQPIFVRFVKQ